MLNHILLQFQLYEPEKICITLTYMILVKVRNLAMHDMSLSRGNLASFQGDNWIGNHVNISIFPLLCNIFNLIFMYHLVISVSDYCLHINHFLS